jgi:phosphate:Na+ symporter
MLSENPGMLLQPKGADCMDIFDLLGLLGGLSLFLFGMQLMAQSLERRAGSRLKTLLGTLTTGKWMGLFTGLAVTALVQSSSATTVMVVGFVNSGMMSLRQAIHVIMGANVGTTVTAWVLSLAGIQSDNVILRLLKPTAFSSILAFMGILSYLFTKNSKKRDTGTIFLGFAVLMFGMEEMSASVSGLRSADWFQALFLRFQNPLLGVAAGALLTAAIQSSSASVGILQALAVSGQVTYGAALPIIMGQNIGTCVTALVSAVGANKNARRAALVHLIFNLLGAAVWLGLFWMVKIILFPAFLADSATAWGIAVAHTVFNVLSTLLLLPMTGFLEKLVCRLVPDNGQPDTAAALDPRLLGTPSLALARCEMVAGTMAACAISALEGSIRCLATGGLTQAEAIREQEAATDRYEDSLGSYLVQLSALSPEQNAQAGRLLRLLGDLERVGDHSVNLLAAAQELSRRSLTFSPAARRDLNLLTQAVLEISHLTLKALQENDTSSAQLVEPLAQVIFGLKDALGRRHILRLQAGQCAYVSGSLWSDILTDLERVAGHCSNIAGTMLDPSQPLNLHQSLAQVRQNSGEFSKNYAFFQDKYALAD